jgi:hypothetical protein
MSAEWSVDNTWILTELSSLQFHVGIYGRRDVIWLKKIQLHDRRLVRRFL